MNLHNRLQALEKKLNPPPPPGCVVLRYPDTAPLEAFRLKHGREPDKIITTRCIESDGNGGIRYIDEGLT